MSYEWKEGSSRFIKLIEGEEFTLAIKKVEKTEEGKYHFKKNGVDQGWHIEIDTDKGKLTVNSWGLYFACQSAGVKPGKTFSFTCVSKGGLGKMGEYDIKEVAPF